jgi:hypothetical protein
MLFALRFRRPAHPRRPMATYHDGAAPTGEKVFQADVERPAERATA